MTARRPRIAFVVHRCGDDVMGGAERLCLRSAQLLAASCDVEILTTCARDADSWRDAYPPGSTTIGGIPARRFSVPVPRDRGAFDRCSAAIARGGAAADDEIAWMRAQGPIAPDLFSYLAAASNSYDRVVFFSYLYATTYFGVPAAGDRAVLFPLAHDEWMLGLPLFDSLPAQVERFAFLTEEERALIERRFPLLTAKHGAIVHVAIDAPATHPSDFRLTHGLRGRVLAYVGRVEPAKGVDELLRYYAALRAVDDLPPTLLLVGPIAMDVPPLAGVVALGQVDELTKWNALACADIACIPSSHESLSLTALEAWAVGTPVLACGASAVLVGQCRRSNGGLWYANETEFVELARTALYGHGPELGANGARFVAERYSAAAARETLGAALGLPNLCAP